MSRKSLVAIILGVVLLLGAATAVATAGSVEQFIADTYSSVDSSVVSGADSDSLSYRSAESVQTTTQTITEAWPVAERLDDTTGVYLRYRNSLVAVVPDPDGQGALITVDRLEQGYRRYYPYVGRRWGADRGFGSDFRGGGPGTGK